MAIEKLEALDYNGVYNSSLTIFRLIEDNYVPRVTYRTDVNSLDNRISVLEREMEMQDTQNNE